MALRNPDASASKQNRNPLNRHSLEKELDRERVTEAACVTSLDLSELKESLQTALPIG